MKKEEEGGCEERRDMRGWERRREGCEEKGGRRRMQWQTTYGNLTILLLALICSICVKCANIRGFVILVFVGANVWTVVTLLVSYFCVYISHIFSVVVWVVVQSSSVGSCWYSLSLSGWWAMAQGSITDVWLGGASGGTEVIAARSWRISQRY